MILPFSIANNTVVKVASAQFGGLVLDREITSGRAFVLATDELENRQSRILQI